MLSRDESVPPEMISLALKEITPGLAPVIHQLWEKSPNHWGQAYRDLGAEAEPALLRRLPAAESPHRDSAVRVLERVGGADSLPELQTLLPDANPEMRVLIDKAIAAIRARIEP